MKGMIETRARPANAGSAKRVALTLTLALILGAIALVFAMNPRKAPRGVRAGKAQADTNSIASAVEEFRVEYRRYPNDLQELMQPPGAGESLLRKLPNDPWDTPYAYAIVDGKPRITSAGPDGVFGTADDISSRDDKPAQRGGP